MEANVTTPNPLHCVEHSIWTPIPPDLLARPADLPAYSLKLQELDAAAAARAQDVLTFHLVGCAGDYDQHTCQTRVAAAMVAQMTDPQGAVLVSDSPATQPAFLFHLGDVTYKHDDDDDDKPDDPQG